MRSTIAVLFPLACALVGCGRSDIGDDDAFPSVLDQTTGGASGSSQGGSGGVSGKGGSGGGGSGGSAGKGGSSVGGGGSGGSSVGGTAGHPGGSGGDAGGPGGSGGDAGSPGGSGGDAGSPAGSAGDAGAAGSAGQPGGSGGVSGSAGKAGSSGKGGSAGQPGGSGGVAGSPAGSGGSGAEGGSAGATTCEGGITIPAPFCQDCVDLNCCGESQSCNADSECDALLTCFLKCGGSNNCQQKCLNKHPGGVPGLQKLGSCIEDSCGGVCSGGAGGAAGSPAGGSGGISGTGGAPIGGSGGVGGAPIGGAGGAAGSVAGSAGSAGSVAGSAGSAGSTAGSAGSAGSPECSELSTGDPVCDACYQDQCCAEGAACIDNASCVDLLNCLGSCGNDPSCQQKCVATSPEGYKILSVLIDCIQGPCGPSCGGGEGGSSGTGGSAGAGGSVGGSGGSGGAPGFCGDGKVDFGEQCDEGFKNADSPALTLTASFSGAIPVTPIDTFGKATTFYNYSSASSHTGYEQIGASRFMLHRDVSTGLLSLVLIHGIDADSSGQAQPPAKVQMKISGPTSLFVTFADDDQKELAMQGPGFAFGSWSFDKNSDGGILGGLPYPGDWSVTLSSSFEQGIKIWQFVDGNGGVIDAGFNATATLQARSTPGTCRTDCTVPFCGDGRLDGGEVCDDGNNFDGDSCSFDCKKASPFLPD